MNAILINSMIPRLPAIGLILLATFAGQLRAQPIEKTQTSPGQVVNQQLIDEQPSTSAPNLGKNILLDAPPPGLQNFEQNFAGFPDAQTLPFLGVETLVGFEYNYRQQTRNDVQRTSDTYAGDALVQIGTGKGTELYLNFPFQTYNDTTIKDRTGQDSFTRNGNGDLRAGFQVNFLGNNGGPYYLSGSVDGLIPTRSYNGNDFPRFISTLGDTNTDTGRRDRNRNGDNYGAGVSLQASVDLPCGWQAGINSSVMFGHPDCCGYGCFYACFDNRFNLTKTIGASWAIEATVATSVSTARRSDVQASVLGGARWTPTPWLGVFVGPTWNATQSGDNIGGMLQASIQWDKIKW